MMAQATRACKVHISVAMEQLCKAVTEHAAASKYSTGTGALGDWGIAKMLPFLLPMLPMCSRIASPRRERGDWADLGG